MKYVPCNPPVHVEQAVNAWYRLSSRGLIALFFFQGTIPGGSYLEILETLIVAGIRALFADEPFFIQQDGVPYFYYTDVCACLE
ncbi:hypothetical protein TNCV_4586031 [Trichonephila clavipes]|nr:hypothetical protein TNCV_4586031 [Trichonephila clavipes]